MDYHSKNVCLIGIIHIVDSLKEVFIRLPPCSHNCLEKLIEEVRLVAYYVLLTVLALLMIGGVVQRSYKLLLPFLVLTSLALAQVALPVLANISQGSFNFDYHIFRIGLGIMTVYPTYTLFKELRSQPRKQSTTSVLTNVEHEKKLVVVV